jgi:SH3-like domain-containing protein
MVEPAPRRAIKRSGRQRFGRAAAPAAIVAGLVAAGLCLAAIPSTTSATSASVRFDAADQTARSAASNGPASPSDVRSGSLDFGSAQRQERADRSTMRLALDPENTQAEKTKSAKTEPKPDLDVSGTRYTTVALNVRTKADSDAKLVTVLKPGVKVKITDTTKGQWRLIVRDGKGRWVKKTYLAKKKPNLSAAGGAISSAACKSGNAMERGLTSDAIKVHRALCARFPEVSSFGGVRQGDGGEHGSGRAVDAMIADSTVGRQMANWVRANAKRLGVSQVIYAQHIWTVQRGSEGWRSMSDRGSATANHYDHVHVTVYGNSAS